MSYNYDENGNDVTPWWDLGHQLQRAGFQGSRLAHHVGWNLHNNFNGNILPQLGIPQQMGEQDPTEGTDWAGNPIPGYWDQKAKKKYIDDTRWAVNNGLGLPEVPDQLKPEPVDEANAEEAESNRIRDLYANAARQGEESANYRNSPQGLAAAARKTLDANTQQLNGLRDRVQGQNFHVDPNGGLVGGFLRDIRDNAMAGAAAANRFTLDASNGGGAMGGYGYATRDAIDRGAINQMDQQGRAFGMELAKFNAGQDMAKNNLLLNINNSDHSAASLAQLANQADGRTQQGVDNAFREEQAKRAQNNFETANVATGTSGALNALGTGLATPAGQKLLSSGIDAAGNAIKGMTGGGQPTSGGIHMDIPTRPNTYSLSSVGGAKPPRRGLASYGPFGRNAFGGQA